MLKNELSVILLSVLFTFLWAGCGTSRKNISDNNTLVTSSVTQMDDEEPQEGQILLLSGVIGYDSIKAEYSMTFNQQEIVAGTLNLDSKPLNDNRLEGLNYAQLKDGRTILSVHKMDNPLVQQMEYYDKNEMGRKTVRRSQSELFLRIQLNPETVSLLFRDGDKTIKELSVDKNEK